MQQSPKVENQEKKSGKGKKGKKNADADDAKPAAEVSPKQDKKSSAEPVIEKVAAVEVVAKVEEPIVEPDEIDQTEGKSPVAAFDELGGTRPIKYYLTPACRCKFPNCRCEFHYCIAKILCHVYH